MLILGWGKCRVGSTAITNLFGLAGVPAFYQPIKTAARHHLVGATPDPWRLPSGAEFVFAKESAGPYVHYESLFNPLEILLEAGWPANRLHLVVLDRHPAPALASWIDKWSGLIGRHRIVENFVLASLNYSRMRRFATARSVPITHYPYELSRTPQSSVPALFDCLGLADRYQPAILTGWRDLNASEAFSIPREPEPYVVQNLHGKDDRFEFRFRSVDGLTADEWAIVTSARILDRYRTSVRLALQ
jgi:hypothetical protein